MYTNFDMGSTPEKNTRTGPLKQLRGLFCLHAGEGDIFKLEFLDLDKA